eukprot:1332400-Pyramimonas_sp.AAC.2
MLKWGARAPGAAPHGTQGGRDSSLPTKRSCSRMTLGHSRARNPHTVPNVMRDNSYAHCAARARGTRGQDRGGVERQFSGDLSVKCRRP